MNAEAFFDTNVLVYAISQNDSRKAISERLLARGGVVSVQVLNELVAVARGKLGMPWKDVLGVLSAIRVLCGVPIPVNAEIHELAVDIAQRYKLHIYDSLIVAAALHFGCKRLYTEDLQHGQTIGSLTIHNPFVSTQSEQ